MPVFKLLRSDLGFFCPAGARHCSNVGEILHGGVKQSRHGWSTPPPQISFPVGAEVDVGPQK